MKVISFVHNIEIVLSTTKLQLRIEKNMFNSFPREISMIIISIYNFRAPEGGYNVFDSYELSDIWYGEGEFNSYLVCCHDIHFVGACHSD